MSGKEKLIDLLDEDKPVANQKFVCVSLFLPKISSNKRQTIYLKHLSKTGIINIICKNSLNL